jgi:tetratricopeptide (TPR) repeat protein
MKAIIWLTCIRGPDCCCLYQTLSPMKSSALLLFFFILFSSNVPVTKNVTGFREIVPASAADSFEKGMLLLHNFEYEDAAELFIAAQEKEPSLALAYWGEAMTYDHPVWGDLDIEKARAALRKFGASPEERIAKAKTTLEKDFIQSANILFGEGSKPDRQKKYSEFLGALHKKYPGNIEVSAFYCVSLLGIKNGWSQWESYNEEAARIAKEILSDNPNHPGALHYLVHANDHPAHAKDGLDAANRYAIAASYAGHALHMPSHIYLALGMWDDVVRSNEVAWKASMDHKEKTKLNNDDYSYHAHLWLFYGYLQQGRWKKANEVFENQVRFTNELPSASARVHLLQMKGHYLFETNDWSSPIADLEIKVDDLMMGSQYNNFSLEGFNAFSKKDAAALGGIITTFDQKLNTDKQVRKANENMTICGVTRFVSAVPTENEIQAGTKLLNRLKALQAWLGNDAVAAETLFKESLPKEGSVVIGPPFYLTSSHEWYGEFLLSMNRPEEAYKQFEKALLASPNRYATLKSQLRAARQMKDTNNEVKIVKDLKANLKHGDAEVLAGI